MILNLQLEKKTFTNKSAPDFNFHCCITEDQVVFVHRGKTSDDLKKDDTQDSNLTWFIFISKSQF